MTMRKFKFTSDAKAYAEGYQNPKSILLLMLASEFDLLSVLSDKMPISSVLEGVTFNVLEPLKVKKVVKKKNDEWKSKKWDWVEDFCELFSSVNGRNSGYVPETKRRMVKFFDEYSEKKPSINLVMRSAQIYCANVDPKVVKRPYYFITKGSGSNREQLILRYINIAIKEKKRQDKGSNKMLS